MCEPPVTSSVCPETYDANGEAKLQDVNTERPQHPAELLTIESLPPLRQLCQAGPMERQVLGEVYRQLEPHLDRGYPGQLSCRRLLLKRPLL